MFKNKTTIILWMSEFIDILIKCKNDLSVSFILPKCNCSNLKWHSVVCLAPKCLYVCLTMYALDELMAGVLGGSPVRSGAGDHSAPGQFEVVLGSAGLKHKVPFRSGEHGGQ